MKPGMRPATPAEAAEDYRKREAALEDAVARGLYSEKQAAQTRAALEGFTGYDRQVTPDAIKEGAPNG